MSQCKSCGAEIIWIEFNGKPHPLDSNSRFGFYKDIVGNWQSQRINESHFATCPNADQHRKG